MPSAGDMMQGKMREMIGTDKKRSLAMGDQAATERSHQRRVRSGQTVRRTKCSSQCGRCF